MNVIMAQMEGALSECFKGPKELPKEISKEIPKEIPKESQRNSQRKLILGLHHLENPPMLFKLNRELPPSSVWGGFTKGAVGLEDSDGLFERAFAKGKGRF